MIFFFFQAEDGIRDADVTGVQTCALPIYRVDDAVLAGTGRDPREADLRLNRRAARDDVPRHKVRVGRVRFDRDDFDLLRHRRAAVQDVGELRFQDADLPVRGLRPVQREPRGPDEGILLFAANLAASFLPKGSVAAPRGLTLRTSLPQSHARGLKDRALFDPCD